MNGFIDINNLIGKVIKYKNSNYQRIKLFASESAFFICISTIPFMMLFLSFVKLVIPDTVTKAVELIAEIMPQGTSVIFTEICEEALSKSSLSILSFSAITTLLSASNGFKSVYNGVTTIYGIKRKGLIRKIFYSTFLTFLIIILLFIFLCLFMFVIPVLPLKFNFVGNIMKVLLIFTAQTVIFYLFYYITVNHAIAEYSSDIKTNRIKNHLPGAAMSSLVWLIFSYLFTLYVNLFSKFSYIYGSLTGLVLFMLIIYFGMIFFFIGADLNHYLIERRKNKFV